MFTWHYFLCWTLFYFQKWSKKWLSINQYIKRNHKYNFCTYHSFKLVEDSPWYAAGLSLAAYHINVSLYPHYRGLGAGEPLQVLRYWVDKMYFWFPFTILDTKVITKNLMECSSLWSLSLLCNRCRGVGALMLVASFVL